MSTEKDTRENTTNSFDDEISVAKAKDAKGTTLRLIKRLMQQKGKLLLF